VGYHELFHYASLLSKAGRLAAYNSYYCSLQISGLHYAYFLSSSNTIAVCTARHETHELATTYLLLQKANGLAINTVRFEAHALKTLLDFLTLWDLDLRDGDLLVILQAYTDYLRLIRHNWRPRSVLEWSVLSQVPLKKHASSDSCHEDSGELGGLSKTDGRERAAGAIERLLYVSVKYLRFLQTRTVRYAGLSFQQLPVRQKRIWGVISGTAGSRTVPVVDLRAITGERGVRSRWNKINSLPSDAVFSLDQANLFFQYTPGALNKLLFATLRCLGLREAEAAGLTIDPETIPPSFFRMEYFQAKRWLRNHLRGDLKYVHLHSKGRWVFSVIDRGNPDYRASHKRAGERREVPWIFPADDLEDLLINALRERTELIQHQPKDHGFLFVSGDHRRRGAPITGQTVYKKYHAIAKRARKGNPESVLHRYSPHTFRHFYATYLLKVLKRPIDEVSLWLGHSTTEITSTFYAHWMSDKEEEGQFTVARMKQVINQSLDGRTPHA